MTNTFTNWHRLFGLMLNDVFIDTPYNVEVEKDLTLKQQFLDVMIFREDDTKPLNLTTLPDGLDNLKKHNLLTYKSLREALDIFAINELIGHSVNYIKQFEQQNPENPFNFVEMQLYAVTTRYPEKLFNTVKPQKRPQEGIYDLIWGANTIRIIVLKPVATLPHNAAWNLFSTDLEKFNYGKKHYTWKQSPATIMRMLFLFYTQEGFIDMSYTYEQFEQEFKQHFLQEYKEEFLREYTAEERVRDLPAEERMRDLPVEERMRGLSAEERLRGLPIEERLKGLGLSQEELEKIALLLKKRKNTS